MSTGELADSLADGDLYPAAALLVAYFAQQKVGRLELRTKSSAVAQILGVEHNRRTTVTFTLSPERYVRNYEPGTASLVARLHAAVRCVANGYPVGFNLEPLILDDGWQEAYGDLAASMRLAVPPDNIHHISIGALRWSRELAAVSTFKHNHGAALRDAHWIEYRPSVFNGTYSASTRLEAYKTIRRILRSQGILAPIWWSMEEPKILTALQQ
jgi:spore photoproduct lyase